MTTVISKGRSRILKWGVNFCNNVRELKSYFNIKKERRGLSKRKKGAKKKGGEIYPISPPLDPRLIRINLLYSQTALIIPGPGVTL